MAYRGRIDIFSFTAFDPQDDSYFIENHKAAKILKNIQKNPIFSSRKENPKVFYKIRDFMKRMKI